MERTLMNAMLVKTGMTVVTENPDGSHMRTVRTVEHSEITANGCPATIVVLGTDDVPIIREGDDLLWVRAR